MLRTIERGQNGWHGYGIEKGNKVSVTFYTNRIEHTLDRADEDTVFIDKSEVEDLAKYVLSGPMFDPSLKDDEIARFNEIQTLRQMFSGLEGGFKATAALALTEGEKSLRSLDYVGLEVWITFWKSAGAKIGKLQNGKVVWE
jgi:hypothetical protein